MVKYLKYIFKVYLCYCSKCIRIVSFLYQSLYLEYILNCILGADIQIPEKQVSNIS